MDRILVFDNGRVAEQGSHAELMAQRGLYRRLFDMQSLGFVDDVEARTAS